jgi:glycosyltransferase involved in cell wall biosynthesis
MNILFVSHSSSTYGAELSLWDLLEHSRNTQWTPIVVCPAHGPLVSRIRHLGIETYVFPHFSWYSHHRSRIKYFVKKMLHYAGMVYLQHLHERCSFRLVYSNTLSSYIGALLASRHHVPHIWHLHEFLGENIPACFDEQHEKCLKWIGRISDRVIYNSETTKAAYSAWIPESLSTVIPNGTASKYFDAYGSRLQVKNKSVFDLSVIGKIIPIKRIEVALKALALLQSGDRDRYHLNIVGDGNPQYIQSLQRMAKTLHISESVMWNGYQEDPLPFYLKSDAVLVNSHLETFCRSACEAMASGCAVIVSDTGEPRRFVTNGETGYTYPEGDSTTLAQQVRKLDADHELRESIVRRAHEYARANWSVTTYAQKVVAIISAVIDGGNIKDDS